MHQNVFVKRLKRLSIVHFTLMIKLLIYINQLPNHHQPGSFLNVKHDIFFFVPCGRKGFAAAVWGFVEFVVTLNSRSAKVPPVPYNSWLKYVQHIWEYPTSPAQIPQN